MPGKHVEHNTPPNNKINYNIIFLNAPLGIDKKTTKSNW